MNLEVLITPVLADLPIETPDVHFISNPSGKPRREQEIAMGPGGMARPEFRLPPAVIKLGPVSVVELLELLFVV